MEVTSRKRNWSEAEIAILVDEVEENKDVLKGKFTISLSAADKAATWTRITSTINAVGGSGRTLKEVKKKWQDVQSSTKKKEVDRLKIQRQTGGGPPPTDIKEWEQKIVGIMSKSVLCGIPGGCDSLVSEIEHVKESEGATCPVDSAAEQPANPADDQPGSDQFETVVFQNSVDQPASCVGRVNGKNENKRKRSRIQSGDGSSTEKLIEIQQEMLGLMKEDLEVKQKILNTLQEIVTCKRQKLDFIMENATSFYTM